MLDLAGSLEMIKIPVLPCHFADGKSKDSHHPGAKVKQQSQAWILGQLTPILGPSLHLCPSFTRGLAEPQLQLTLLAGLSLRATQVLS